MCFIISSYVYIFSVTVDILYFLNYLNMSLIIETFKLSFIESNYNSLDFIKLNSS